MKPLKLVKKDNSQKLLELSGMIDFIDDPTLVIENTDEAFNGLYFVSAKNIIFNALVAINEDVKSINIELFKTSIVDGGHLVFFKIFKSMVFYGRLHNFETIKTISNPYREGDIVTRLIYMNQPFVMTKNDHARFLTMMLKYGRKERTIRDLLMSNDGRKFWREKGFSFSAIFYLNDERSLFFLKKM